MGSALLKTLHILTVQLQPHNWTIDQDTLTTGVLGALNKMIMSHVQETTKDTEKAKIEILTAKSHTAKAKDYVKSGKEH